MSSSSSETVSAEPPRIKAQYHVLRTDGTIATAKHIKRARCIEYRMQDGTMYEIPNLRDDVIAPQYLIAFDPASPVTTKPVFIELLPMFHLDLITPTWLFERLKKVKSVTMYVDETGKLKDLPENPLVSGVCGNIVVCKEDPKTGYDVPFVL
jgi:hypothetical protein